MDKEKYLRGFASVYQTLVDVGWRTQALGFPTNDHVEEGVRCSLGVIETKEEELRTWPGSSIEDWTRGSRDGFLAAIGK